MSGVSSEVDHLTAPRMRLALGPACLPRDRARSLRARLRWMLKVLDERVGTGEERALVAVVLVADAVGE